MRTAAFPTALLTTKPTRGGVSDSGSGAARWTTRTPETDDVAAALKKGDLKFTLDGYKLKGSWVLVRTRGWSGSRGGSRGGSGSGEDSDGKTSWLLIKHRDDWSGPVDIAEFAPLSVKTEGDFADILAQDNPDIWRSNRPAEGGDTGKLFQSIIARALALQAEREGTSAAPAKAARTTATKKKTAAAKKPAVRRTKA